LTENTQVQVNIQKLLWIRFAVSDMK